MVQAQILKNKGFKQYVSVKMLGVSKRTIYTNLKYEHAQAFKGYCSTRIGSLL